VQEVTAEEKLSLGLPVKLDWRIYFAAPEAIAREGLRNTD
jgi:hypothetical protein